VEVAHQHLQRIRGHRSIPKADAERRIRDALRAKYADLKIDAIVPSGAAIALAGVVFMWRAIA
jgi:hypothetical protein